MLPLLLAGALTFHGKVVSGDTPLPGVTLRLVSGGETRETRNDPTGAFAFDDVPAGRARLTATLAGWAETTYEVCVDARAGAYEVRLESPQCGDTVYGEPLRELFYAGVIRDEHGLPLPGARVELLSKDGKVLASQISSRGGEVEFHMPLQPRPFHIRVSRRGYATQTVKAPCVRAFNVGLFPDCGVGD